MAEGSISAGAVGMQLTFSSDLTDKFDFTFIFGDLNFRLNISRLHADWLISRQGTLDSLYYLFVLDTPN